MIICTNLTVDFTAVSYHSFLFHILGNVAFVDGRLFGDSLICKAAVINGCIYLIAGKHFIYSICPVCSPDTELLITVPLFRNRILSAVAATFRMLVDAVIALFLCVRCGHINLLFFNFISVLLFPAIFLCSFEFSSCKSFFFPIFYTEIFFFCFILPCSVFIQWTDGKQNVCMRIVSICIVNSKVSTHAHIHKILLNKILKKRNITVLI